SAHRHFQRAANTLARSPELAAEIARNRQTGRRQGKGIGGDMKSSLAQRTAAECLGTAFLLAAGVGSGIMAAKLAGGNGALALLGNTLPTGAILVVLILALGPISGAHFNPAVSLVMSLRKDHPWREFFPYAGAQIVGGCVGTLVAHGMFELPLLELAVKARSGPAQWFAEFVATFGLIVTILAVSRFKSEATPVAVGL